MCRIKYPIFWISVFIGMICTSVIGVGSDPDRAQNEETNLKGEFYESSIPDTLDLAEMARLGLNGIIGMIDAENDFEAFTSLRFGTTEPHLKHSRFTIDCAGKFWESFPYLRSITGSDLGKDIEEGFKLAMLGHVAEDGLFYSGFPKMTAWHEYHPPGQTYHAYPIGKEPFASVLGNARAMLAMMAYPASIS